MTAFLKFWVTSLHFLQNQSKCSNWFSKYHYKALSIRHLQTPPKKSVAPKFVFNSKLLYLCTSNRKKASLVPKVGLHRRHILVLFDVRRRTSMTTKIRARNEASGELKYQPSKHTQSMINYSITMRSVNSNLLAINQAPEHWSFRSWLLLVKIFEHIWGVLCQPLFPEGRKSQSPLNFTIITFVIWYCKNIF